MCEFAAQEKWVFVACRKYDSKTDLIKRLVQQNCNNFKNSSKPYISPSKANWSAFVSVSWLRMRSACMTTGVQWRNSHYFRCVTTVSIPHLLLSIQDLLASPGHWSWGEPWVELRSRLDSCIPSIWTSSSAFTLLLASCSSEVPLRLQMESISSINIVAGE